MTKIDTVEKNAAERIATGLKNLHLYSKEPTNAMCSAAVHRETAHFPIDGFRSMMKV